jgi:hypothetical protein
MAGDGATLSLRAARINPECIGGTNAGAFCARDADCDSGDCGGEITPTNEIQASPGDVIVCEIYGSDWSPEGQKLRAWMFTVDGTAFGTAQAPVLPAFWDDPTDIDCQSDADCPPGSVCWVSPSPDPEPLKVCAGSDHTPECGALIDMAHGDYVFAISDWLLPQFSSVRLSTLSFRYSSVVLDICCPQPVYTPPPKYFATFTLELLPTACGTFTVTLVDDPDYTLFTDVDNRFIPITTIEGLRIDAGPCAPVSIDPPDCAIDARQPSEPDGSNTTAWDSMTMRFAEGAPFDPCQLTTADFAVRQVPGHALLWITDVTCTNDSVQVFVSHPITTQRWACIEYLPTGDEYCIAHLPGDANGDGVSAPADILRLIDCLNGVAFCEPWQCDIDRSGLCEPPDITRLVDLLNGAGAYAPWLNQRLEPCPVARN